MNIFGGPDHWEDWPNGDRPDVLTWVLFAAGICGILLIVWFYAGGLDVDIATRQFTERP